MPLHTTEVAAVLADPTRFAIYEKLAADSLRTFTVQEVAELFSLHPNVARTHLSRLEEIGLVQSSLEKSGRGGRPGKRYSAADRSVTLQFPRRDWQLLARLLVETVEGMGAEALRRAEEAAYRHGLEAGLQAARGMHRGAYGASLRAGAGEASTGAGTVPAEANGNGHWPAASSLEEVQGRLGELGAVQSLWHRQDGALGARFTTCVFRELVQDHPDSICAIHRAMLRGLFEGILGGPVQLTQQRLMSQDEPSCDYVLTPAGASGVLHHQATA